MLVVEEIISLEFLTFVPPDGGVHAGFDVQRAQGFSTTLGFHSRNQQTEAMLFNVLEFAGALFLDVVPEKAAPCHKECRRHGQYRSPRRQRVRDRKLDRSF